MGAHRPDGTAASPYTPLPLSFYRRPVLELARELIGKAVVRIDGSNTLACRIVETEAYGPDDPASHSRNGPTARNASMFQAGGVAYVYLIYGIHSCLNVVAGWEEEGSAVLIRAGEPLTGELRMWENRFPAAPYDASRRTALTSGPGKLCAALGIDRRRHDGVSLAEGELTVCSIRAPQPAGAGSIGRSCRIGITSATERLWRFSETGNPFVSSR